MFINASVLDIKQGLRKTLSLNANILRQLRNISMEKITTINPNTDETALLVGGVALGIITAAILLSLFLLIK